jgi:hypothetical protein
VHPCFTETAWRSTCHSAGFSDDFLHASVIEGDCKSGPAYLNVYRSERKAYSFIYQHDEHKGVSMSAAEDKFNEHHIWSRRVHFLKHRDFTKLVTKRRL